MMITVAAVMTVQAASGYLVGPAVSLEKLTSQADLVVKATVTGEGPAKDPWFRETPGFEARETTLTVVSVLKGSATRTIRFRHFDRAKGAVAYMYSPQHYSLAQGRSYLVFAARQADGSYRQLWEAHTSKEDQGVFLASDARPRAGKAAQVVLEELSALANSETAADAVYGIEQLDELSGGRRSELKDFDRQAVLATIAGRVASRNADIATAAIKLVGGDSPYLDDEQAPFWLAGMGQGHLGGLSPLKPSGRPLPGAHRTALIAAASGPGDGRLRALAIRALGRGTPGEAPPEASRWLKDPQPLVRQAAVVLLADSPTPASEKLISAAAADAAPEVRVGAARAIGFAQLKGGVPLLGRLLGDAAAPVRKAAALSLLSFDVAVSRPVLEANARSDYGPLFVNALARVDPKPWLPSLAEIIEKQSSPREWWGGAIPAGESWELLFGYVKSRPAAELKAGTHDASLDALEKMRWFSSSEPRDLYALYVVRGLKERAQRFRASCAPGFDMEYYFKMVDESPATYVQ